MTIVAGQNDRFVELDPGDASLAAWDASLGGPGTRAHAMAKIQDNMRPDRASNAWTMQAYRAFARAAHTSPEEIRNAGRYGGTVGAV